MNGLSLILILIAFVVGYLLRSRQIAKLKDENLELRRRLWERQWFGDPHVVVNRRPSVRRPA